MSTTFRLSCDPKLVPSACDLCDGSGWDYNADRERKAAGPFDPIPESCRCWYCRGTGLVEAEVFPVEPFQLSGENAAALVALVGEQNGEYGSIEADEVHEYLRRCIALRNHPDPFAVVVEAPTFTEGGHRGVRLVEDGNVVTIQRMGPKMYGMGRSAEYMERRLAQIYNMLDAAAKLGCGVQWG